MELHVAVRMALYSEYKNSKRPSFGRQSQGFAESEGSSYNARLRRAVSTAVRLRTEAIKFVKNNGERGAQKILF